MGLLQKLIFKPGVNRENTRYTQEGQWWDMSAVRFRSGTAEKIGGWVQLSANTFQGVARFLHNWITLGGENLLAVGTNLKMYIERGQVFFDITPIRYTVVLANPFLTGAPGSAVVTATATAHSAITGDFVTFSGAATTDGILAATLNAEFQIVVTGPNTFTFTATACSAGGVTGGGATVTMAFQPNTGPSVNVSGTGWGAGPWGGLGGLGWGMGYAGSGAVTLGLRQWVGGNFGQDFIYSIRDGGIYYWSAAGAINTALSTRGTTLASQAGASDAPVVADNLLITDDQHVIIIGTNARGTTNEDPLLVRWCAQGNPLNWTPAITNTAGDYRLTAGSYTYAVKKMRQENLIWTDSAVISMQFVGPPVVFSFTTLADNISIASVTAVAVANNVAYWMGKDKFYSYNGQVQTLNCDLRKYVFGGMNLTQLSQVYAGTNAQFNEVTWFYCSTNALSPDSYVVFNYLENLWTFGTMPRTAWLDSPLRATPIAAGADGKLYYHEVGVDDGSTTPVSAIASFIESADFDIGDGQKFSFIERIIPDVDFSGSTAAVPALTLTLKARDTPGSNFLQTNARAVTQTSVIPFAQFTEMAWTRIRGRQLSFRLDSTAVGVTWQIGTPRIGIREDGER